jgi:type II secretory pathway pseudopilin PulG
MPAGCNIDLRDHVIAWGCSMGERENRWRSKRLGCMPGIVWNPAGIWRSPRPADRGFALVAALLMMVLLSVLAVGLAGLAAIELRRSSQTEQAAIARAHARLALAQAIGQLQRTLGPDQRVSATAEILGGDPAQPQWTGAWRSTKDDGSPFFQRDPETGNLRDIRADEASPPAGQVIEWLVSGTGNPASGATGETAVLGRDEADRLIQVSKVALRQADGATSGHQAWWTGDLGVRVNLATRDAWKPAATSADHSSPGKWYRLMTSQAADPAMMAGNATLGDEETRKLASTHSAALTSAGPSWARQHAFNITVDSLGVLADPLHGGLKRDLTAFLASDGEISDWQDLAGLNDADPVIGEPSGSGKDSRMARISPRFGLLREWSRLAAPLDGRRVAARLPEFDEEAGKESPAYALANEAPVKLDGNTRAALQPVLVEATNYIHLSTFRVAGFNPARFQLRHHHYPRVVLWNPYNVELEFDRAIIMIQGNGRQEMWTENEQYTSSGAVSPFRSQAQWLSFEGGRSTSFNASNLGLMSTEGYLDPYLGSYFFSIPATRFAPGECLVFSPAKSAEYDCLSPYRPGPYNLNANELTCELPPDPARSYYVSGTSLTGGTLFRPLKFWYAPTPYWSQAGRRGVENQGDDIRAVLKHAGSASTLTFEDFDKLPQLAVMSASLQFGAGREPRIAWSINEKMDMQLLDQFNPRPTMIPNVRTREGVRLRWFDEHESNLINSGRLTGTPYLEEALLANWNPRAAFVLRSPWENIGGGLPAAGSGGGPWFFGAATRDLFDQAVSWEEQTPVFSGGRCRGNPFGPPQEGNGFHILFDVPRAETGVLSLAQFQHAKLSDLIWHPSYAIGNSLADPRLGTGGLRGLDRTVAQPHDDASSKFGGFHENQIGWSADNERSQDRGAWATTARATLGGLPETDNLVFDLSFELNHALWDRYFLSTGTAAEKRAFAESPLTHPLPNGRMRPAPGGNPATAADDLADFHKAASRLLVDGAFNVNSTRVEAWKALLASTRLATPSQGPNVPFPRVLNPPGRAWQNGAPTDGDELWTGYRELTPEEIDQLARAIVAEVKLRGPFVSLADFVNRRLATDQTGRMGALEAAIEKSGINARLANTWPLANSSPLPDYNHPDNIPDATRMEQTLKPSSKAWGAPAWLTQADVLQVIGPVLAARSDTFVIRAYGDAVDRAGRITARAWCEAVVQRTPRPLDPDPSGLNPRLAGKPGDFGREFVIQSFRWLSPDEI